MLMREFVNSLDRADVLEMIADSASADSLWI